MGADGPEHAAGEFLAVDNIFFVLCSLFLTGRNKIRSFIPFGLLSFYGNSAFIFFFQYSALFFGFLGFSALWFRPFVTLASRTELICMFVFVYVYICMCANTVEAAIFNRLPNLLPCYV